MAPRPPAQPGTRTLTVRRWGRELGVAIEAAREAGRIQLERYERLERIVHKSEKDVVTEVDHLSEAAIIGTVRAAFPDDPFLAEESGHSGHSGLSGHSGPGHPLAGGGAAGGPSPDHPTDGSIASGPIDPGHRIWVVDPLDGTVNYANGIPHFCTSVGLVVGGRPTVGVVLDPVREDLFAAVAGQGAWLNGTRIRHPGKERLVDSVISLALPGVRHALRDRRIRKAVRVARSMGSSALGLSWVGNGRFDALIQLRGMSLWDIAAAGLIASEAGATVTDAAGGPWFDPSSKARECSIVAAGPAHHARYLELLR
jgi:myo-inositol-1(or 4)-monophosphatase